MKSPIVQTASYISDKGNYSELQVLRSGAGYYVGTIYNNPDGYQEPGSRDSGYFASANEAAKYLRAIQDNSAPTRLEP